MKALKSPLAKAALSDPVVKEQLRCYVATRAPTVIELNGKRYRPELWPSADNISVRSR